MKRVPYEIKRNMYMLLLREGKLTMKEMQEKAYFVTGAQRKRCILSYLRNIEGINQNDGTYKLNIERCPVWLQYAIYVKRNGPATTMEIANAFGHRSSKVHNETHRYVDVFQIEKRGNRNMYEVKIEIDTELEVDR